MGCSPSKGHNFGTQGPFGRGRILLPGPEDAGLGDRQPTETREFSGSADGDTKERTSTGQTQSSQKEPPLTPQKRGTCVPDLPQEAVNLETSGSQAINNNSSAQGKLKQVEKQDTTDKRLGKKPKKNNRGIKPVKKKEKEKKTIISEQKVDFPEPLVKAHQAAYGFLNPSINHFDVLLGLLDQATQTQVSVQPMVAFMALRYDEINRGLEEMAYEGEKLLKENGDHLAWPSQMKNLSSSSPLKPGSVDAEPPPDLLQQLLQYTTQRMQNVCQAFGGIGNSALEEAVEYFASLSELLEEKLQVKRATDARLLRLLTRIETASLRKPGPEDSALFSEDSGIGAESESLAGSERRLRRESCESTGTNRTSGSRTGRSVTTRGRASSRKVAGNKSPRGSITSIDSTCTLMAEELKDTESILDSASLDDGEEDGDDNVGDRDEEERDTVGRRRAESSPLGSSQQPRRLPPKRIENPQNVEMTLKMKDAISGRIQFVPSSHACARAKITDSPKNSRRQWADDEERSCKRPQSAAPIRRAAAQKARVAKERRSQSAESLRSKGEDPTLLELERTQKCLDQRLERMSKGRAGANTKKSSLKQNQGNSPSHSPAVSRKHAPPVKTNNVQPIKEKPALMRHTNIEQVSSNVEEDADNLSAKTSKGPIRATPPPSPPSSPRPASGFNRGRNSVRKLIDTFSQGREESEGPIVLGPLKGVRKCGVPVMPSLRNIEAILSTGITSCRDGSTSSEKMDDLDLESLPPPPLEVLLDNSFEGTLGIAAGLSEYGAKGAKSTIAKRAVLSQRLRSSVQAVLPCKGSLPHVSRISLAVRTDRRGASVSPAKSCQALVHPETESEKIGVASLQKQARKIIHLPPHSSGSHLEESFISSRTSVPSRSEAASQEEREDGSEPGPAPNTAASTSPQSSVNSSQPSKTTAMSRVRMLPCTPSAPSTSQQRHSSPHSSRRQPTPPSSTSPPASRKLPTPPLVHRRLPSPPVVRPSAASAYTFKAPSPPASPKVQRWSRASSSSSSNDSSTSRLMSNARSVFCPASPSLFEAQPFTVPQSPQAWTTTGVSILPRPWGSRGRTPAPIRGPRPFIRRSHSDRRPSLGAPPHSACNISVAQTCGSEPSINTQGLEDDPTRNDELWTSQSDLRATPRSVSHPDLCIVGQALHRD